MSIRSLKLFCPALASIVCGTAASLAQPLVLNEVDYDTIGTDTTEFIEIKNISGDAVNLAGLSVVLINGANNLEYARYSLGTGMLAPSCYLVLVDDALSPPLGTVSMLFSTTSLSAINNIQNGAPDGLAIINTTTSTVMDSLSYEGAFTASSIVGFPGLINLVQGTALPSSTADSNTVNASIQRSVDGVTTQNHISDWGLILPPSLGRSNSPCANLDLLTNPTNVAGLETDTFTLEFSTTTTASPSYSWYYEGLAGRWHLITDGLVGDPDTGLEFTATGATTPLIFVSATRLRGHPNVIQILGVARSGCSGVQTSSATITVQTCPCVADFDASGGTPDAGDVDAFFIAWLSGDASADADCSGGTPDAGDVDAFFAQWLAGGC